MSKESEYCFETRRLTQLLHEQLPDSEESHVLRHVGTCPDCQRALEAIAADQGLWSDLRKHLVRTVTGPQIGEGDHVERADKAYLDRLVEYLGPTDRPDMLGRVANYEVCGLVGYGSTGSVVKAFDSALNRYVAIKILSPTYSHHGPARRRFEREARAAAAVSHEHVVPIYAVDEFRGSPYFVMQYVSGGSLQQRIDREGPLGAVEVVRIGMQVSSGLAAAHAQGIVHRDVKPANVMLHNSVDRVMVTDFGLARVADEAGMTQSGVIAGTPQFMSPEQARGEAIDHRSDLFSLGSLMYAASTGRPPFRADTVYGVLHHVCEATPVRIREINPEIPEWLEALIAKLMSKKPDDRFDSAEEVQKVLADELAHLQGPTLIGSPDRWWLPAQLLPTTNRSIFRRKNMLLASIPAALLTAVFVFQLAGDAPRLFDSAGKDAIALLAMQDDTTPNIAAQAKYHSDKQLPVFESDDVHTFAVESGGQLTIDAEGGLIEVITSDERQVQVNVRRKVSAADQQEADELLAKHLLEIKSDDSNVKVMAKFDQEFKNQNGPSRFREIAFRVTVPRTYNVDLKTTGGHITTMGELNGNVRVNTAGGHIELADVHGPVSAHTSGGHIKVSDIAGPVDLHTKGGHIFSGNVKGAVVARTAGGHIKLGHIQGNVTADTSGGHIAVEEVDGIIEAKTSGGNITATISKQPEKDCALKTSAGNIKVRLSKQTKLNVEARAAVGKISAPFARAAAGGKTMREMQATLNDGGPSLSATTGAGNIVFDYIADDLREAEESTRQETTAENQPDADRESDSENESRSTSSESQQR
jgi:serine/threonine-protein kinase